MENSHNLQYKEAMARLEVILKRIDNTDVDIDELAGLVEESTALLKNCRQILQDTGRKVQSALDVLDQEFTKTEPT